MIRSKSVFFLALCAIFALNGPCKVHAQSLVLGPTFQGLGDLPDGIFNSEGWAISGDGKTVAGIGNSASGGEAFRWTSSGGMVGIGQVSGAGTIANSVSTNGSVIVGWTTANQPFRWTAADGIVILPSSNGITPTQASYVSGDGNVVVGLANSVNGPEAFRWTAATGMVGLGDLPGGSVSSSAYSISSDGSTIVGVSGVSGGTNAFRWTSGGGMVGLGDLPGGSNLSRAYNVSANGSVVVGYSQSSSGRQAFRWTQSGGMVGLGDIAGGTFGSTAWDISADGSIIVGDGTSSSGRSAFLWTQATGMVDLKEYLISHGVTGLDDWHLGQAYSISADGTAITGFGSGPNGTEAWLVTNLVVVPEPGTIVLAGVAMVCMMLAVRKSRVEN